MWGQEDFAESLYGVGWGCLCPVFLLTSLSLTLCRSMSFYYFLLEMIKLTFRRRPTPKPVVPSGVQLTPLSTWESVFLPPTHRPGPTPSPSCESEKWFQTLPNIPRREHRPCLRTTGVAHLFRSLC